MFATYPTSAYIIAGLSATPGDYYYGIHRFPTAVRAFRGANGFPHNPLTFANLNQGNCTNFESAFPPRVLITNCGEAHNTGEIWTAALWEVRARFAARLGLFPGNQRAMQIVLDGMKLAPLNPTFLQERDAAIAAAYAGASYPSEAALDAADVWRGFAVRGLGFGAQINTTSPINVTESFNLPPSLLRPKRADFDGDSKTDVSVFRASEGNWYLNRSTAGFTAIKWGLSTDTPVMADFDGDGKTDITVFRGSADNSLPDFYILYSSNFTFSGYNWGLPNDIPIVEDFDGDERADVGVYRPSNSTFYLLKSLNGEVNQIYALFPSNYKLITGDFDGDGKNDIAVYRNGTWYINQTTAGLLITQFGVAADVPAPSRY
ncbi:MAG TPA: M36 family metallopeptidase [Pyrinomonadaceae bacterium]